MSRRTELPATNRNDWATIKSLFAYLWDFKARIVLALVFMASAKLANIGVPVALKHIVDALTIDPETPSQLLQLPLILLLAYGLLRLSTSLLNELRNAIFARASQSTVRKIAGKVFSHLHDLALRFHLDRQTGGVSRDIERGTRSVSNLMHYLIFSILPTIFEISVVCIILLSSYSWWFTFVIMLTVTLYFIYTYKVTTWRTKFRVRMNEMDSRANTAAIDSLINYETVKYFNNEAYEVKRYDDHLKEWEKASVKSQVTLAMLNVGQGLVIAIGLTIIMVMAGNGVVAGNMTLGDFVLVNAFLIQLYIPLNFLGTIFREINHCLTDVERMFGLLEERNEVTDKPNAISLSVSQAEINFHNVYFDYRKDRSILQDINFTVHGGQKVAVVGESGAGKSTLARLLFRFYDVSDGIIDIDGQDLREVTRESLRQAIGVVPQDTVLFNDSIEYNIQYGRPDASHAEVVKAANLAHLDKFISALPQGLDTIVGERGLKLSGGEKQRIAIARTILKDPPILILDEATSALDSKSEQSIQIALNEIAAHRTTLVIAHRLSTIIDSDQIIVLKAGRIIEQGNHGSLLALQGNYAEMWALQQEQRRHQLESLENYPKMKAI